MVMLMRPFLVLHEAVYVHSYLYNANARTTQTLECWSGEYTWDVCCRPPSGDAYTSWQQYCWGATIYTYWYCCRIHGVFSWSEVVDPDRGPGASLAFHSPERAYEVRMHELLDLAKTLEKIEFQRWDAVIVLNDIFVVNQTQVPDDLGTDLIVTDGDSYKDALDSADYARALFILSLEYDDDLSYARDIILKRSGRYRDGIRSRSVPVNMPNAMRFVDRSCAQTLIAVASRFPANLSDHILAHLEATCQLVRMTERVQGSFVEVGVYHGRGAFAALSYMAKRKISRHAFLFDTFAGFNDRPAEGAWLGSDEVWAGTHGSNSPTDAWRAGVEALLREVRHGGPVDVHVLDIRREDLPLTGAVAAANIDVDSYEATRAALAKVAPRVAAGGALRMDDAFELSTSGAAAAMDEFLDSQLGRSFTKVAVSPVYFLIRFAS